MIPKTTNPVEESLFDDLVDEVIQRIRTGARVDIDQLAGGIPEAAERLRQIVPAIQAITHWDPDLDDEPERLELENPRNKTLGDFLIVRQIGQGGMGVVYEAKQLSIKRAVALKVLPFAALVDPRALQRFKNEVTAVATLEHPHIVSVYAIGEERGIHYYAMRLIRGQSIAAVIRELQTRAQNHDSVTEQSLSQVVASMPQPDEARSHLESPTRPYEEEIDDDEQVRTVARGQSVTLTSKITDPSYFRNVVGLMIQASDALHHAHQQGIVHRDVKPGNLLLDAQCQLFVTDFGLARIENTPELTLTGDFLGTLRYMSPEQVQAGRVMVDHRTDIYSLGATLYELLTLTPIWSDTNKAELIRRISLEEPRPPRKLNSVIPTDLETIVLKAISRNPNERYDSARTMAEDLQRFLDNKPIEAKRPTVVQRINKWTHRNPAAMWATVCVLSALATAFAISTVLVTGAYRDVAEARADETKALENAETKSDLARSVVDDFYTNVAMTWLNSTEDLSTVQRQILVKARDLYQMFAVERADKGEDKYEVARHMFMIGMIDQRLGNLESALSSLESANEIACELVKMYPDDQEFSEFRNHTQVNAGIVLVSLGRSDDAELAFDTVRANKNTEGNGPDRSPTALDFKALISSWTMASYQNDPEDGVVKLLEVERKLEEFQNAISDEQMAIVKDKSGMSDPYLQLKVEIKGSIGERLFELEEIDEAIKYFREGIDLTVELLKNFPDDPEQLETAALNHFQLGLCLRFADRRLEAFLMQEETIRLFRSLPEILAVADEPADRLAFPELLAWSLCESTDLLVAMEEYSLAEGRFQELFEAIDDFAQQYPVKTKIDGPDLYWPQFVAECRTEYGLFLSEKGDFEKAAEQFRLAIESKPEFAHARYLIASLQQENGEQSAGVDDYREAARFAIESVNNWDFHELIPGGWGHIEIRFLLSAAFARIEQWEQADYWYQEAMAILSAYPYPSQANPFWRQEAEKLLDHR